MDSKSVSDWDAPLPKLLTRRPPAPPVAVPDDWDNDDDDNELTAEVASAETNQRIWQDAYVHDTTSMLLLIPSLRNAKAPAPMPSLIVSSSSSAVPLPVEAFQPTMKILKRPKNTLSEPAASQSSSANMAETLKEREAKYQAARDRIFGETKEKTTTAAAVIRNPKGPEGNSGFKSRQRVG